VGKQQDSFPEWARAAPKSIKFIDATLKAAPPSTLFRRRSAGVNRPRQELHVLTSLVALRLKHPIQSVACSCDPLDSQHWILYLSTSVTPR
jgi:hypothetical protein